MFYSQILLSKKSHLSNIWLAAHCHKRLRKDQINQTDISFSVDKILHEEVHLVTHRILGFLVLGLARIYSKKVEYLFYDCSKLLSRLGGAPNSRITDRFCLPCPSIILPESFNLDAFDLGNLDDQSSDHNRVKFNEELLLPGASKGKGIHLGSLDQDNAEDLYAGANFMYFTPTKDVFSPSYNAINLGIDLPESSRSSNVGPAFFLEDRLEPMPMSFAEIEGEVCLGGPSREDNGTEDLPAGSTCVEIEERAVDRREDLQTKEKGPAGGSGPEDEEGGVDLHTNEESPAVGTGPEDEEDTNEEPPAVTESGKSPTKWATIVINLTPQSKFRGNSVNDSPGPTAVLTPGTNERAKLSRKRKCIWDEKTILSNKIYKHWIGDSSSLVCIRPKMPHTAFHVWKAEKILKFSKNHTEPIIPCPSIDPRDLDRISAVHVSIHNEPSGSNSVVQVEPPVQEAEEEAIKRDPPPQVVEEVQHQPATPIESVDRGTIESVEKGCTLSNDRELDFTLMDEVVNSYDTENEDSQNSSLTSSERTRAFGEYLHKTFEQKKERKEEEVISLAQIATGKTKKDSAKLFYELLVLKSGSYVDVRQDNAYDDIIVLETPSLKQTFGAEAAL